MRDGFTEGFFSSLVHRIHPIDLMGRYLRHGSAERIPGLAARPETLTFAHLDEHVRPADRARHDDADTFSLYVRRRVGGRSYGLEFRLHFVGGEPYADAVVPFGAAVELPGFLRHFRTHHAVGGAPGNWDSAVRTDRRDLREGLVRFGNGREVWFQVGRGPVVTGRPRLIPWHRHRLVTGRLQGNLFGTASPTPDAAFPDRHPAVGADSAEQRAFRRYLSRLDGPLPLRAARPSRRPRVR
ncbi:hypothetical protein ACIRBX_24515 [Kitasatospora sp. NPDC096147]|uniref:hypothetical protein n=1 Tax=Kitasatospora sp. NPDC096147 TaxID=3364093 RepID=UPI003809C4FA